MPKKYISSFSMSVTDSSFFRLMSCILAAGIFAGTLFLGQGKASSEESSVVSIAVTQIVEHPALDKSRQGLEDELKAALGDRLRWTYENAQGRLATAVQIAQRFVGMGPDVIVTLSTASTQTLIRAKRPQVFIAVTSPIESGIVDSLAPGRSQPATGTIDTPSAEVVMDHVRELFPEKKPLSVGLLYSSSESNSVFMAKKIEEDVVSHGGIVTHGVISQISDIPSATQSLVSAGVDVILLPPDNSVASAIRAVSRIAEKKVLVVSTDLELVASGIPLAIGYDRYAQGREAGHLVLRILKGEDPRSIAIEAPQAVRVLVKESQMRDLGQTIPHSWKNVQKLP